MACGEWERMYNKKKKIMQEGVLFHLQDDGMVISQDIRDGFCYSVQVEGNLYRLNAANKQKKEHTRYILSKPDEYQFIIDFPYMREEYKEFDESLMPGTMMSITFGKTNETYLLSYLRKSPSSKFTYCVLAAEEIKPIWISLCGHTRDNIKIRKIHSIWNIQID